MRDTSSIRQSHGWQFAAIVAVVVVLLAAGPAVMAVGAQEATGSGPQGTDTGTSTATDKSKNTPTPTDKKPGTKTGKTNGKGTDTSKSKNKNNGGRKKTNNDKSNNKGKKSGTKTDKNKKKDDKNKGNTKGKDKKGVNVEHKCTGGFFEKRSCQMMNSIIGWFITMVADFIQDIITSIVNAIIGIPVPKHNGEPAIIQPPTNKPWNGLYDSWLTYAVPLGILEWVLMVLGILFSEVYVSDPAMELQRRELKHRSWKVLFGILGSFGASETQRHNCLENVGR